MKQSRWEYIRDHVDMHDDLPDGAFFAVMNESHGIDYDELADWVQDKRTEKRNAEIEAKNAKAAS